MARRNAPNKCSPATTKVACNVKVAVRVRPALPREISSEGCFHSCIGTSDIASKPSVYVTTSDQPVLIKEDGSVACGSDSVKQFSFDHVFDQSCETCELYDKCLRGDLKHDALAGVNATVFAYGQTGTGKTHTMLGDGKRAGIVQMVSRDVLAAAQQHTLNVQVEASYIQLTTWHITDLLSEDAQAEFRSLRIRENEAGEVTVEGMTKHTVRSEDDVLDLVRRGSARRKTASTKLNVASSRSHAVLTLHVTVVNMEGDGDEGDVVTYSKINLVDLAGSERVKDSGVEGEHLKDACGINLSLFHLAGVVQALIQGNAPVPYKNDLLCYLLKDALGGNCKSTLVATVSPAQLHAQESRSTLQFAASCSRVRNHAGVNTAVLQRERPWAAQGGNAKKSSKPKEAKKAPWHGVMPGSENCPGGRVELETSLGLVSCLVYGSRALPLVLCLHGHPSSAEDSYGHWLVAALVHSGFLVVAIDMPGQGGSGTKNHCNGGQPFRTRSEFNLDKGGAADVACAVIVALKGPKGRAAAVFGYDWGGGIALSMGHAARCRRHVGKIVAFHPSYNETENDELKQVGASTLLIWCQADQFHSWPAWKGNAKKLQQSLGPRLYEEFIFKENAYGKHGWSLHTTAIERCVVRFLTGTDPLVEPSSVHARPLEAEAATDGTTVVRRDNIVMASQVAELDRQIFEMRDAAKDAVAAFIDAFEAGRLRALYAAFISGGSGSLKQEAARLFSSLPCLLSKDYVDCSLLTDLGLWSTVPNGWHAMQQTPRYYVGRRVLVRAPVCPRPSDPAFMALERERCSERGRRGQNPAEYTTFRAVISGFDLTRGGVDVDVECSDETCRTMRIDRAELLRLNQPHQLPIGPNGEVRLEDGIILKKGSSLTRAKICEMALALRSVAESLDFDASLEECERLQCEAVAAIRGCLDLNTFQRDDQNRLVANGERFRDRDRYCGDDAARFAVHGQGHCHTVSSVMAAFLSVWQKALGIDLKYRGGFAFSDDTAEVSDSPEHHQWLEFMTRPSCSMFTCDLYREDGPGGTRSLLHQPIEQTYQKSLYPHGQLPVLSGFPVTISSSCASDFADSMCSL